MRGRLLGVAGLVRLTAPVAVACALVAVPAGAATAASPAWAAPVLVDAQAPFGHAVPLHAVSCPTTSFCAAVDREGNALISTTPSSGGWMPTPITGQLADPRSVGESLTGISCPTASFCVAVDNIGEVATSTNPTGGPTAWSVATVDTKGLLDVSCPSTSLCVATDEAGNVVTSTNPTGGPPAWAVANVDGTTPLTGVSCPSTSLCVVTGAQATAGDILTATNPSGGKAAWTVAAGVTPHAYEAVSCPATTLCVVTDLAGHVVTSTNPTGGAAAWTMTLVDDSGQPGVSGFILPAVSCASTTLCAVVDDVGKIITSTNPAGGAGAWSADRKSVV